MSSTSATAASGVTPPVAPVVPETTSTPTSSVATPKKYESFFKALIPAPKTDSWAKTALKILSCVTVVPLIGALIMDGLRGLYNWVTKPSDSTEEADEASEPEEEPEGTPPDGSAAAPRGEPEGTPPATTTSPTAKTRIVEFYNNHSTACHRTLVVSAVGLAYFTGTLGWASSFII